MQDGCYQAMAATCWDSIVTGFRPGRVRAMELLDIQPSDHILCVGEGSGLDFDCLPPSTNPTTVWAFDFSSRMVSEMKRRAAQYHIPDAHCMLGDAQRLPFPPEQRFHKIYFPLSLASIPHPHMALREAERVLAPNGRIVIFEKLVDDDTHLSLTRRCIGAFTQCIFADITRNLTQMLGDNPTLKITHYESTEGQLTGCMTRRIGAYYRLAVLVRRTEYPQLAPQRAELVS
tara:strand:+ start:3359 stop:4051 length:693 start_codon:yes stop_codon:yes gene_type:complete